jgi:hypothetical protein
VAVSKTFVSETISRRREAMRHSSGRYLLRPYGQRPLHRLGRGARERDHYPDRPALVHRPVALRDVLDADRAVEDAARLDPALQDVREGRFDGGASRLGDANPADRTARPDNAKVSSRMRSMAPSVRPVWSEASPIHRGLRGWLPSGRLLLGCRDHRGSPHRPTSLHPLSRVSAED